jgi:hypothetical protein
MQVYGRAVCPSCGKLRAIYWWSPDVDGVTGRRLVFRAHRPAQRDRYLINADCPGSGTMADDSMITERPPERSW